jgi:hypothetical protein
MINSKIAVHITFYVDKDINLKLIKLNKVLKSYLSLSKQVFIFVHTNIIIKKKMILKSLFGVLCQEVENRL